MPTVAVSVVMYYYHPRRLARSNIEKQNFSHRVNDVCNGSPSRIRIVRRISFGITTLPRSSMRLTIPVAFISMILRIFVVRLYSLQYCKKYVEIRYVFWWLIAAPCKHIVRQRSGTVHAPHVGRDSKSVQKFAALLRKVNNFLFREAECRTASAQKPPRCSVIRQIFRCEPISKNVFAAASHLQYQRTLHIVSRLCSKVLDFGLILISEIVKAKAILLAVHYLT